MESKDIDRLKNFIDGIISSVNTDTKIKITLNPELYANNKSYIDNIIQSEDSEISIVESTEINFNDCTVEWSDGYAQLDTNKVFSEISSKLDNINDNQKSRED